MVQHASIQFLATNLVELLAPSLQTNKPAKQSLLQSLEDPKPARTNQFEIRSRLEGLEEKFRVFNNDEIADALASRVDELATRSDRWTPEVLSLLLQMSDRPLKKSKIEDLDKLIPDSPPAVLTWSDILADDPVDNRDGIWNNVDFAADGSDDDEDIEVRASPPSLSTPGSSDQVEYFQGKLEALSVEPDRKGLDIIIDAQFWNKAVEGASERRNGASHSQPSQISLTEIQMIREIIFMLLGLPTSAINRASNGSLFLNSRYRLAHVSQTLTTHTLEDFATLGDGLESIRIWNKRRERIPLLQTFQSALGSRLSQIERSLSTAQEDIMNPSAASVISLLQFSDQVQTKTHQIMPLCNIVEELTVINDNLLPFRLLELLFDRVCVSHSIGDSEGFDYLAKIFFECFQAYLKPLQYWMKHGEINKHDQTLFIKQSVEDVPLASIWERRFRLLFDESGSLHAPHFLHVAAKKIFNTGKSVDFLKYLDSTRIEEAIHYDEESQLDFHSVCGAQGLTTLMPFSELFDLALERWIASRHHSSSKILRRILENQCGLHRALDAVEYVYFAREGTLSGVLASEIFERMDRGKEAWNDGFLLTELFRSKFAALPCIDVEALVVRPPVGFHQNAASQRRSMRSLESLLVGYTLPWPIANIVRPTAIAIYQRVFILLMQVQRAKQILERRFPRSILTDLGRKHEEGLLVHLLRHRLLWFINTFLSYLTDIAVGVATTEMRLKMANAEDFDAMVTVHQEYIVHLEDRCLISKRLAPILQAVISLLDLVILFSDACASRMGHTLPDLTNRSTRSLASSRHLSGQRREQELSSSEEDSSNDAETGDNASNISFARTPFLERAKKTDEKFREFYSFILAGLRGVSRAGGEPCWEMLAESLAVALGNDPGYG